MPEPTPHISPLELGSRFELPDIATNIRTVPPEFGGIVWED
jgi:hypothetical protein